MADTKSAVTAETARAPAKSGEKVKPLTLKMIPNSEIQKMWAEAQANFEKLTEQKITSDGVKFEEVEAKIKARQGSSYPPTSKDKHDVDKWERAKNVGRNMLGCLNVMVRLTSSIAPYAIPGPAQPAVDLCCNALSILISIPESIEDFHASIDSTFTKVSASLDQIAIYQTIEEIPEVLARNLQNVIIGFITICAQAIRLQKATGFKKITALVKRVASGREQEGLSEAVAEFERAVENHRRVEQTATYALGKETHSAVAAVSKDTKAIHRSLQALNDDATVRKESDDRIKNLNQIRETFGLKKSLSNDSTTTAEFTSALQPTIDYSTGSWICQAGSPFSLWVSKGASDERPLLVTGPPQSGKSAAVALMIKNLESSRGARTSVTHYFFPRFSGKTDEDQTPVLSALRLMAFQLAQQDDTIAKTLAKYCKEKANSQILRDPDKAAEVNQLWQDLKLGSPGTGAIYYLVFEGMESVANHHTEAARALLKILFSLEPHPSTQSAVKVLISGEEETLRPYFTECSGKNGDPFSIDMEEHNGPDMRQYISDNLDKRRLLMDRKEGSPSAKARQLILDRLPKRAKGRYSNLNFDMEAIERRLMQQGASLNNLEDMLESDENLDSHQNIIKNLQQKLEPAEIDELNELLKWVAWGAENFTVDYLEAAMHLHSGKVPLQPLEDRIKARFAGIFEISEGDKTVTLKDGVKEVVTREDRTTKTKTDDNEPTITATITITNASVQICQHFLWDLAQKAIRDGFRFEFNEKSAVSQRHLVDIAVNEADSHLALANYAFKYLDNPDDISQSVAEYVLQQLPFHLKNFLGPQPRELEENKERRAQFAPGPRFRTHLLQPPFTLEESKSHIVTPEERRDLVGKLYDLFQSDDYLVRHADIFKSTCWNEYDMIGFRRCLEDEQVVRQVNRAWSRQIHPSDGLQLGYMYLGAWADRLVHWWLRDTEWALHEILPWIRLLRSQQDHMLRGFYSFRGDIANALEWAQRDILRLADEELDFIWYARAAETWLDSPMGSPLAAVNLFQKALEFPEADWRTRYGLARAHERNMQRDLAAEQYQEAIELCGDGSAQELANLRMQLGELWDAEEETVPKAQEIFEDLLKDDPHNAQAYFFLIQNYATEDCVFSLEAVRSWMESIVQVPLKAADGDQETESLVENVLMAKVMEKVSGCRRHLRILRTIYTVCKEFPRILGAVNKGLEEANRYIPWLGQDRMYDEGMLIFTRGAVAFHYDQPKYLEGGNTQWGLNQWHECRKFLESCRGTAYEHATNCLAFTYFDRLVHDRENAPKYLQELEKLDDHDNASTTQIPISVALRASYLAQHRQEAEARDLLGGYAKAALDILEDHDDDNDSIGYDLLASIFMHCGDLPNALAAISWMGMPDQATWRPLDFWTPIGLDIEDSEVQRIRAEAARRACEIVTDVSRQMDRLEEARRQCKILEVEEMGEPEGGFNDAYGDEAVKEEDETDDADDMERKEAVGEDELNTDDVTTSGEAPMEIGTSPRRPSSDVASGGEPSTADPPKGEVVPEDDDEPSSQAGSESAAGTSLDGSEPEEELDEETAKRLRYRKVGEWFHDLVDANWCSNSRVCSTKYCENEWEFDREIFFCVYCEEHVLCRECLEDIRDPDRDHLVDYLTCHSSHKWIKAPAWGHPIYEARYKKSDGEGRNEWMMNVGGEIPVPEDGKVYDMSMWAGYREMGNVDWIDEIRDDWKIPRPERVEMEEEDGDEEEDDVEEDGEGSE